MTRIDQIFKGYGEESFGKKYMERLTDSQIEEARCWAFNRLTALTTKYGKQAPGTAKKLFCDYISNNF